MQIRTLCTTVRRRTFRLLMSTIKAQAELAREFVMYYKDIPFPDKNRMGAVTTSTTTTSAMETV